MTNLAAFLAGFLAGRLAWLAGAPAFANPVMERRNFRDLSVPLGGGVALVLAVVAVEGGRILVGAAGIGASGSTNSARTAVFAVVLGFGFVGFVDDLVESGSDRGFRGHLAAMAGGRLTTGGIKVLGGSLVAVVAAAIAHPGQDLPGLLRDGLLIAMSANLGNLFDRRPGRVIKVSLLTGFVLVATTAAPVALAPVAVVLGAAGALLLPDLHERVMMGDAGANALGAALGVGAVVALSAQSRTVVALGVLALNALSEVVSFTKVIEAVPPLRAADRAGRLDR